MQVVRQLLLLLLRLLDPWQRRSQPQASAM